MSWISVLTSPWDVSEMDTWRAACTTGTHVRVSHLFSFENHFMPVPPDENIMSLLVKKYVVLLSILQWGSPSASDPRAKNTGQRATKGTVLTSQRLSPWCDCRRLGSTLASWRWQDINVGNPLRRRALLSREYKHYQWGASSPYRSL